MSFAPQRSWLEVDCRDRPLLPLTLSVLGEKQELAPTEFRGSRLQNVLFRYALVDFSTRAKFGVLTFYSNIKDMHSAIAKIPEGYRLPLKLKWPVGRPWIFDPSQVRNYFPRIRIENGASFKSVPVLKYLLSKKRVTDLDFKKDLPIRPDWKEELVLDHGGVWHFVSW